MFSLFLTLRRLVQALREAWVEPEFRNMLILLLMLIASGTAFYAVAEGWSIVDSLYFSVITLATVGYGDLAPVTTAGKLFTIIYILVGIGLFVAVARDLATGLATSRSKKIAARRNANARKDDGMRPLPNERSSR